MQNYYQMHGCLLKERSRSLEVIEESLNADPKDEKLIKQYINIAFSAFNWDEVINGINRANINGIEDDGKHALMIGIAFFEKKILKSRRFLYRGITK